MKNNQQRFLLAMLAAPAKGSHLQNCHAGKRVGVAIHFGPLRDIYCAPGRVGKGRYLTVISRFMPCT